MDSLHQECIGQQLAMHQHPQEHPQIPIPVCCPRISLTYQCSVQVSDSDPRLLCF